tara:strand:+ start:11339 stop:11917 length:579 start_codon:yes stop_codon:yes gene_type:complete
MKFSKKEFDKKYKRKAKESNLKDKEGVEELFEPNGDFGGDIPHKPNDEVKTDTGKAFDDKSDFKKGVDQTGDDFVSKTKNTAANFFGWNSGTVSSMGGLAESTKGKLKGMFESKYGETVDDNNYSDVNDNNIPDINELAKPMVINKTKSFVDSINSSSINGKELGMIMDYVVKNVDLNSIPDIYKEIIKKSI